MTFASSKLTTVLWFDHGEGRKAAEFYASVFPNSHVDARHNAPTDYPDGEEGNELVVEFTILGQPYQALNGGPMFKPNQSVSFMVITEDQAETDLYWNAIVGNGGAENQCGWCQDRWGYSWQITPRVMMEAMSSPDKVAAKRAMKAMYQMKKIEIATIEEAFAGEAM